MQFTTTIFTLFAAMAVAAPTEEHKPTPPNGLCKSPEETYCCKAGGLGLINLQCALFINVIGSCNTAICCTNVGEGNQECSPHYGLDISIPILSNNNIEILPNLSIL